MFAFKPWTEKAIHISLIAVILFNALIPTAALAMPLVEEKEVNSDSVLPAPTLGTKGLRGQFLSSSLRSSISFQDATATVMPTEAVTGTATPEPFDTLPTTPSTTPTQLEATPTVSPTIETTVVPSGTPTATQTPIIGTPNLELLSLAFAATPAQVKAGERVTFTLTIINKGITAVNGLLFSNILPEGFQGFQSDDKNFIFDLSTREVTWKQESPDPAGQIPPGGSLTLTYSVLADSPANDVTILDTANFSADGMKEPLL